MARKDPHTTYINDTTVAHWTDHMTPSEQKDFEKRVQMFYDLARRAEPNSKDELYYEYRAYMSHEVAEIMVKEFYNKEWRSGTSTNAAMADENLRDIVITKDEMFGDPNMSKGVFSSLVKMKGSTPDKLVERSNFLDTLINKSGLSTQARTILITRLLTGAAASGKKTRQRKAGDPGFAMDLEGSITDYPPEYDKVVLQLRKLVEAGVDENNLTARMVLKGVSKEDPESGRTIKVDPLIRDNNAISRANKELQDALMDLAGTKDVNELAKFLDAAIKKDKDVNESVEPTEDRYDVIEEAVNEVRKRDFIKGLDAILSGGRVKGSVAIQVIVTAVAQNMKMNTPLASSTFFRSRDVKKIARIYLEKLKSGRDQDLHQVQHLVMAPVIAAKNPLPLKKKPR